MIAAVLLATSLSRFVVMHANINAYGVAGTATIVVDRQSHRFVRRFHAGAASEQEGFDGTRAWRADATGLARVQGNSGERREIRQWSAALAGAVNERLKGASLAGATDHIRVTFDRYKSFGGLVVPGRITSRSVQNGVWSAQITRAETVRTMPASEFAPPAAKPHDFKLSGLTRIPVSMTSRSPVITVTINGKHLQFLFDTGGQNVITFEAAKSIGLRLAGKSIVSGGGGGIASIAFARVPSYTLGRAVLLNQPFIVLPASSLPGVDGIVGYELLARLPARLDMAHETLELAPNVKMFGAPVARTHFDYFDRQPEVGGALDDITGPIAIDTGSNLTAQIQAPVVRKHALTDRLHATVAAYANDVGGRYPIFLVRAQQLRLGSVGFPDPIVDLLTRSGASSNSSIVANAGDGILRRWVLVFDYPHQTIDFRPGGDLKGSVVHDRSGLFVTTEKDTIVVAQVLGGTPAARAGVKEGAKIVSINGVAVHAADLARIRLMLQGNPGTVIRLTLSDGSTHDVTLEKYL